MKKLFTLILMALAIVTGAKAQATEDIDISSGWGWGYNSKTTYEDGVMTITLTDGYGAGSIGWGSGANWSKYNKLTVVIDSYTNDWGKVYFTSTETETESGDDHITIAEQSFSTITSQTEVVVNFDPTKATSVYQLSIQGKAADDVIKVSRVYLTEAVSYEEKELTLTDGIHILSSEFDAYDDANEVKLTIANNSGESRDGWGIGKITNIDNWGDAPADNYIFSLTGKAGTEFTIFTTVGELKKVAKNNGDDYIESQYNRTGVSFSVYNQCSLVKATVLIPESDSPSFSAVTISSTLSGTDENIPVVANGEALFADLSDEATNDFVINSITITPVGSFQHVQGKLRLTSEDGNTQIEPKSGGFYTVPFTYDSTDDVWKAENLDIKLAGGDLDLDANTNYILEFYFEGSTDGNTYDYTYKNGANNFKVKFQNGTPPVQFKAENTATMTLNVDGTATTINFNKNGSVYNNGNDDLGEVSVLRITGFTTTVISSVAASSNLQCWITTADGSESTQEHGMYTENVTISGDEQSFTATVTNTDIISITDAGIGLTDGETYILHGYFQVKDNDEKYYFAPNKDNDESFAIQFTYKAPPAPAFTGASINLTTGDTAEDITLTDNMTEAVSYENVEKFIINSASATTVGSVSNATLYYYVYVDDTWDNQVRRLALTSDGSGNWTATMNQDFVQAFGWASGHTYTISFYFLGDDGNGGRVAWDNSGYNYEVNITVKDTSTGINGISTDEADENEEIYNIAGQKVGKNYKGLVIKNGKKQIVK